MKSTSFLATLWNLITKRCIVAGNNTSDKKLYLSNEAGPKITGTAIGTVSQLEPSSWAALTVAGGAVFGGNIQALKVYNSVWNDLTDAIVVPEDTELEYGYCYRFDGEKYTKTIGYMDSEYIGINSDTEGMCLGIRSGVKQLHAAVAGFVLAYVDKEYRPGTVLTCTEDGYLTAISDEDKRNNPEMIIATYWKPEKEEMYEGKVKVNGRHWVKIR